MLEFVLNFLFPPVCGICRKDCKEWICKTCEKKLINFRKNQIIIPENENYDKLIYLYEYKKEIRKLIIRYKFKEEAYLHHLFINQIQKAKKICRIFEFYDIIIPVPMDRKKQNERGYNQTVLLANELGKILHKKVENVLIKKEIKMQSKLSKEERIKNVQDAFKIKYKEKVENKKIILIDDIFTTGATVSECAKTLKKAGAKEILVFVIAKD